jgi:hypothetical protein
MEFGNGDIKLQHRAHSAFKLPFSHCALSFSMNNLVPTADSYQPWAASAKIVNASKTGAALIPTKRKKIFPSVRIDAL